jgi:hypothetical protein
MRAIVKQARVGTQGPAKSANKGGPSVLMTSHKSRLMTTPSLSRSPLIHALPSLCVTSSCARMCAWPPVLLLQAKVQWVNGLPQEPSKGPGEYPPWSIPANLPSWERGLSPHRSRPPSMPCTRRSPPHQTMAATTPTTTTSMVRCGVLVDSFHLRAFAFEGRARSQSHYFRFLKPRERISPSTYKHTTYLTPLMQHAMTRYQFLS